MVNRRFTPHPLDFDFTITYIHGMKRFQKLSVIFAGFSSLATGYPAIAQTNHTPIRHFQQQALSLLQTPIPVTPIAQQFYQTQDSLKDKAKEFRFPQFNHGHSRADDEDIFSLLDVEKILKKSRKHPYIFLHCKKFKEDKNPFYQRLLIKTDDLQKIFDDYKKFQTAQQQPDARLYLSLDGENNCYNLSDKLKAQIGIPSSTSACMINTGALLRNDMMTIMDVCLHEAAHENHSGLTPENELAADSTVIAWRFHQNDLDPNPQNIGIVRNTIQQYQLILNFRKNMGKVYTTEQIQNVDHDLINELSFEISDNATHPTLAHRLTNNLRLIYQFQQALSKSKNSPCYKPAE